MSSSGWELVTKNKKDKNSGKNNKLTKVEKKKFIENAPKVEDFRKYIHVYFRFYLHICFTFYELNFAIFIIF